MICLENGITEREFWDMTPAEIGRLLEVKAKLLKRAAREQAAAYYTLADLIGISVARAYNGKTALPAINEVYPNLFSKEEVQEQLQEKKAELSMIRFRQFADSHNKKFEEANK